MVRRGLAGVLAVVMLGCVASDALAKRPVYRDPPSYRGLTKAPKTKPRPLPTPRPVSLASAGTFPDTLVDEAGTAHIVWNEDRGDAADVVVYCRLKRGASGCDATAELVWVKEYGPGDGPNYNIGGPPKIVLVGNQLVVLSKRYPTTAPKPDMERQDSTVLEWVSEDGGSSWAGPAIVGKFNLDGVVVMGPDDDPTILNLGIDPLCSAPGPAAACVEAYKSGQYTSGVGNLSTAPDQNYYATLALDGGLPLAGFADLQSNTILRRWSGAGSVMDPATWSAPTVLRGEEPVLAGGPGGTYLMSRPGYGRRFDVRALRSQPGGTLAAGRARVVSDGRDDQFGRLLQDPSGRLHAAWQRRTGRRVGVMLRSATSGTSFGPGQRLIDGAANGQIELDAAADGGGFAALNHTGGINSEGQIVAAGFGRQAATGRPGLGGVPGGSGRLGSSCQKLDFGRFSIDAAAGCFLRGTGSNSNLFVTQGEVNISGLRIVPDAGCRLVIDPRAFRIDTIRCSARVIVSAPAVGDIVLFHGELHRDLSKVGPGSTLFEFPTGLFRADVFGFKVAADIKVRLERDGVHIPVDLRLPPAFGGFSGHAELIADSRRGLHVGSLNIRIGPVPLGVLVVNSIELDYQGSGDRWTGKGSVTVPAGGKLDASVTFALGDFEQASIEFTPTKPIPIGPFVYLLSIHGGFRVEPAVQVQAGATLGAGAAVQGEAPVKVRGTFTMTFPKTGPAEFRLDGTVSVFVFELGNGHLRFQTDGYADFGGHVGLDLGPLTVDANADGFVDAGSGTFGTSVEGTVEVCVPVCVSAGASVALSSIGFAACGRIATGSAGVEFPWSDFNPGILVNPVLAAEALVTHIEVPCSTDGYRIPPPRAAQTAPGGGVAVDVPGGLPTETIVLRGTGGAPKVSVSGPGGVAFSSDSPSSNGFVATVPGVNAAYVVLRRPREGTYTVTPAGGAPFAGVLVGHGYEPARVRARLSGRGSRRRISYRIADFGHGQRVTFVERGAFGTRLIGSTKRRRGTLRFAPADVAGRRRTLLALVEHDGMVQSQARIARFVAPRPSRPGAVRRLRASRSGTTVTVRWRRARGAARYVATLRGSHGTRLGRLVKARSRRLRFRAVRRDERLKVVLRPLSKRLRPGPARRVSVRPERLRTRARGR
jgi:hypothetical protein